MAGRVLGERETERLRALEPARRRQEFLRAWTRQEARAKCTGAGLALARAGQERGAGRWEPWSASLDMGPGCAASLALEHEPGRLHCWNWNPARLLPFCGL